MNDQLRSLIQAQIAQHPSAGPEEIAYHVAQGTPVDELRTLFASVLVGQCRTAINQNRHRRRGPKPVSNPTVPTPYPRPSPKLSDRRNGWAEELRKELQVAGGVRKPLRDCTADDVRFCIKEREETVGLINDQVARLSRILALLDENHAATVADLPHQPGWRPAS